VRGDPARLLPALREAVAEAGERILEVYRRDFQVQDKADGTPLTEADRAAHEWLLKRLSRLTPDWPVLSEESEAVPHAVRRHWDRYWLVDPLDGTREFIQRNGEFTVNVALVAAGRPVLGVVGAPVLDRVYAGLLGQGAWRAEGEAPPEPIRVRSYRGGPPVVVASRSHRGPALEGYLARLGEALGGYRTRACGSSLKFCLVAEGEADVYPRLGPTSEWDTAAAQCVVEAAGGRVVDFHGRPLAYNKPNLLNPWFVASGAGAMDWTRFAPADGGGSSPPT